MNQANQAIIEKIKELKKIKPRSEWQALNRDFLLSKITTETKTEPVKLSWQEYGQFFVRVIRQRFFLEPAVVILLVLSFSVASSFAVNAAFYSLPGEPLYRMKLVLEKAQLAITPSESDKVQLKIEFAQKRVEEFDKIVSQTDVTPEVKTEQIHLVMKELQKNVGSVKEHVDKNTASDKNVSGSDLEKTLQMAIAINSKTEELAKSLDEKIGGLTESEKVEVQSDLNQTVESVQQISLSAQELIKESQPNQEADEPQTATSTPDVIENQNSSETEGQGVVEGAATSTINTQSFSESGSDDSVRDSETTPETVETTDQTKQP